MNSSLMSAHQKRVAEFMEKARQEIPDTPVMPSEQVRILRAKLILEEALETITALGVEVTARDYKGDEVGLQDDSFGEIFQFEIADDGGNLEGVVDGCADLSVVTIGTLLACGVPDLPVLGMVDGNNLAKFGPGHYIRDDGKLVKPTGHTPPDIAGLLKGFTPVS